MMRALLVDSPDDPAAWLSDLEYRLGPDLLVAPMTDPDGRRSVYLPEGDWVDWWTGQVHPGRRYVEVRQPLHRVPLYARRGAMIPVTEVGDTVGDGPFGEITLLCFDVTDARTVIRDVDGDTGLTAHLDDDRLLVTVAGPATVSTAVPQGPGGFRSVEVSRLSP
jgi:alpha-D-xyloside xylohydrolase